MAIRNGALAAQVTALRVGGLLSGAGVHLASILPGTLIDDPGLVIDTSAPTLWNLDPAAGALNVPTADALEIGILDDLSGIESATIEVWLDDGSGSVLAYSGSLGGFQGGYSGSINIVTGNAAIVLQRLGGLPESQLITVRVVAADIVGHVMDASYTFMTAQETFSDLRAARTDLDQVPGFPLDAYRFLLAEIRKTDQQGSPKPGTKFLERYFIGINRVWQQIVYDVQRLPTLWSVEDIDADKLQWLKTIVGWTNAPLLKAITDALSEEALRRLIAVSGRLWKTRGPEDAIVNVLQLLTVARLRIWNWFDFRWILGETGLGEERQGSDPWLVHLPSSVEDEDLIDVSGLSNRADGTAAAAIVGVSPNTLVKAGHTFRLKSGVQNGAEATIIGITGAGPYVINLVQGPTNGITLAFSNATWEIVNKDFEPDAVFRSNLRIVDNGTLDRTLVKRILRLMRAAGERYDITYLSFLDLFLVPDDDTQWQPPTGGNLVVGDGLLKMRGAGAESTFAIVAEAATWAEYIYSARVRGGSGGAGNLWGVTFYRGDASNYYACLVNSFAQQVVLRKVLGGVTTTLATVDLNALGFTILEDVFYTLRITCVREGATNRIQLFVDGFQLLSTTDVSLAGGSVGFMHDAGATIEIDEAEVIESALGTDSLEINETP